MIRIEKLSKKFRDGEREHVVLDGLDLSLAAGAFVALVGRSGSGKSTLLNCVAGLEQPDSGRIFLGNEEITGLDDHHVTLLRRRTVGIIFQFFNLLPTLSVLDNVALPGLLDGGGRREINERALELLVGLGLGGREHETPDHLSGGEQQRVATARALINEPMVLLADEPTGNLDSITGAKTLELLQDVNTRFGVTILMATHSREAAAVANQTLGLDDGRIVELAENVRPTQAATKSDDSPVPGAKPGKGVNRSKLESLIQEITVEQAAKAAVVGTTAAIAEESEGDAGAIDADSVPVDSNIEEPVAEDAAEETNPATAPDGNESPTEDEEIAEVLEQLDESSDDDTPTAAKKS